MKLGIALLSFAGMAAMLLLVGYYGFAGVGAALALVGWSGLAAITLYHLLPMALCALAWRVQLRRPAAGMLRYVWFRWTRDAGGDVLALLPASGELLGIRLMALSGIETALAAASTVVDLTLEMCGQVAFTLLGLALLILARPAHPLVYWAAAGLASLLALVLAFALAQRAGLFRLLERLTQRLAREPGWSALAQARGIHERIHRLYADRRRMLGAFAIHFIAWIVGVGEAGIALYLMGAPLGFASLIMLESLSYALRSAAFFVPGAAGVQEGGYVLLGALFGIGPEAALALSLLKRGREIVLGVLALGLWHAVETGRVWRRAL